MEHLRQVVFANRAWRKRSLISRTDQECADHSQNAALFRYTEDMLALEEIGLVL